MHCAAVHLNYTVNILANQILTKTKILRTSWEVLGVLGTMGMFTINLHYANGFQNINIFCCVKPTNNYFPIENVVSCLMRE